MKCEKSKIMYYNPFLKTNKNPKGQFFYDNILSNRQMVAQMIENDNGSVAIINCGKCYSCKEQRSREWSLRLQCENESYKYNKYFLTLTYSNNNQKSLNKKDFQNFIKRLRNNNYKIKYFGCGEYGPTTMRPHYHLILFTENKIDDLEIYGQQLYTSEKINNIWKNGNVIIGIADNGAMNYTSGYVNKKLEKNEYKFFKIQEPFKLFSKGIGKEYLIENEKIILQDFKIYINGNSYNAPRYYLKYLKEKYPKEYKEKEKENFLKMYKSEKNDLLTEKQRQQIIKNQIIVTKNKNEFFKKISII